MTDTLKINDSCYKSPLAKRLEFMGIPTKDWEWRSFRDTFGFKAPIESFEYYPTLKKGLLKQTIGWSQPDPKFVPDEFEIRVAILNFARGLNHMIIGPTGSGKSYFCKQLFLRLGMPVFCVACTADTDKAELFGTMGLKDGDTVFKKGIALLGMEAHGLVLLDEGTAISPKHSLDANPLYEKDSIIIDGDGSLESMVVTNPGHYQLMITSNTGGFSTGDRAHKFANVQDPAWRDRSNISFMKYKHADTERKILMDEFSNKSENARIAQTATISCLLDFASHMRQSYEKGIVTTPLSLRGLSAFIGFLELTSELMESFILSILNRVDGDDEKQVFILQFETSFNQTFKAPDYLAAQSAEESAA